MKWIKLGTKFATELENKINNELKDLEMKNLLSLK